MAKLIQLTEPCDLVLSLTEACPLCKHPLGCVNPENCPLYAIRMKPANARLSWVLSRKPSKLIKLLAMHRLCLSKKIARLAKEKPDSEKLFHACALF